MRIIVLGGSPKGERSVTMRYVEYLQRRFPDVYFDVRQPAYRIRHLIKKNEEFQDLMKAVEESDGVLWAFPLYYMAACSDYIRFIELIGERNAAGVFAGKPAAALTTSIHFFDNIAMDYIRAVSEDLKMGFVDSHPAEMRDLMKKSGRIALEGFFETFRHGILNGVPFTREFPETPVQNGTPADRTAEAPAVFTSGSVPLAERVKSAGTAHRRIAIVTDTEDGILGEMVEDIRRRFEISSFVSVVNLQQMSIAGGCRGCLRCGMENVCRYDGSDDIRDIYTDYIKPADVVVMASKVRGRWYSSRMKAFVDRGFFNTHQPIFSGKQVAVLLEGDLTSNPVLREALGAFVECMGGSLAGIIASAGRGAGERTAGLEDLVRRSLLALECGYLRPRSFLGVGGGKVFRDEIYTHLRVVFRGDHRYYRRNGMYKSLPHKQPLALMFYRMAGIITSLPPIRRKMAENMKDFMLMPFRQALEAATSAAAGGAGGRMERQRSAKDRPAA